MSGSSEEPQKKLLDDFARDKWVEGLSWIEKWFAKLFDDYYFDHPIDTFNIVLDLQMITNSLVNDYCEWSRAKLVKRHGSEALESFRKYLQNRPSDATELKRRSDWLVLGYLDKTLSALVILNEDRPNGQRWESSYGKDESNADYEIDGEEWNSLKWHGFDDGVDLTASVVALVFLTMHPFESKLSVLEIYLKDQTSRKNKRASGGHNAKWRLVGKPLLDENPSLSRTALATLILEAYPDADSSAVMFGLKSLFTKS